MSHNVTKLPTAATSYYTIHKAKNGWDLMLVTPATSKSLKTKICRFANRADAVSQGKAIADRMHRPFKAKEVLS